MASKDEEEVKPSWLEEEPTTIQQGNDNDETTPLFGTGPVSLEDQGVDEESGPALSYGSVPTKDAAVHEKDDEDETSSWHSEPEVKALDKADKKKKQKGKALKKKGSGAVPRPRKNCCLLFFTLVEMVAILSSIGMVVVQVLPLFYIPLEDIGVLKMALRCYISLFCVIFILVECETPIPFLRNSLMFQNFFTRGLMYSFVGLVGMEEAYEVIVTNSENNGEDAHMYDEFHIAWAPLFLKCASWPMLVTGVIYMVLGLCFFKQMRDHMRQHYRQAMEEYGQEMKK